MYQAGNIGIGLALVANARGYRTPTIPETQSQEKKDAAVRRRTGRGAGGPYSNPNNYQHRAPLADELRKSEPNGVIFADQWNNLDNRRAHYVSTGPGSGAPTARSRLHLLGRVRRHGFAGTSIFLRETQHDIVIGCADPRGAAMYNLFERRSQADRRWLDHRGIGLGRVTPIIEDIKVEKPYLIGDEEAVPIIFDLLEHEGLCLGGSSGINIAGAARLAKDLGPGKTIVTVLCDYGTRYQSKLFDPAFLREKGLPVPAWLTRKSTVKPPYV